MSLFCLALAVVFARRISGAASADTIALWHYNNYKQITLVVAVQLMMLQAPLTR